MWVGLLARGALTFSTRRRARPLFIKVMSFGGISTSMSAESGIVSSPCFQNTRPLQHVQVDSGVGHVFLLLLTRFEHQVFELCASPTCRERTLIQCKGAGINTNL